MAVSSEGLLWIHVYLISSHTALRSSHIIYSSIGDDIVDDGDNNDGTNDVDNNNDDEKKETVWPEAVQPSG